MLNRRQFFQFVGFSMGLQPGGKKAFAQLNNGESCLPVGVVFANQYSGTTMAEKITTAFSDLESQANSGTVFVPGNTVHDIDRQITFPTSPQTDSNYSLAGWGGNAVLRPTPSFADAVAIKAGPSSKQRRFHGLKNIVVADVHGVLEKVVEVEDLQHFTIEESYFYSKSADYLIDIISSNLSAVLARINNVRLDRRKGEATALRMAADGDAVSATSITTGLAIDGHQSPPAGIGIDLEAGAHMMFGVNINAADVGFDLHTVNSNIVARFEGLYAVNTPIRFRSGAENNTVWTTNDKIRRMSEFGGGQNTIQSGHPRRWEFYRPGPSVRPMLNDGSRDGGSINQRWDRIRIKTGTGSGSVGQADWDGQTAIRTVDYPFFELEAQVGGVNPTEGVRYEAGLFRDPDNKIVFSYDTARDDANWMAEVVDDADSTVADTGVAVEGDHNLRWHMKGDDVLFFIDGEKVETIPDHSINTMEVRIRVKSYDGHPKRIDIVRNGFIEVAEW